MRTHEEAQYANNSTEDLVTQDEALGERYWDLHDELDVIMHTRAIIRNVLQERAHSALQATVR